jgi:hypothetical protein
MIVGDPDFFDFAANPVNILSLRYAAFRRSRAGSFESVLSG